MWGCLSDKDSPVHTTEKDAEVAGDSLSDTLMDLPELPKVREAPAIVDRAGTVLAMNTNEQASAGIFLRPSRAYPYGSMAAALIGFRGRHGEGLFGIEYLSDTLLLKSRSGKSGTRLLTPDNRLPLTISKDIQLWAEEDLSRQMKRLKAATGSMVIMDVRTGELLAMASQPGWDPENAWDRPDRELVNHAVEDEIDAWLFFPMMKWAQMFEQYRSQKAAAEADNSTSSATSGQVTGDSGINETVELFENRRAKRWGWTELTSEFVLWSPWKEASMKDFSFDAALVRGMWKIGLGQETGLGLSGEKSGSLPAMPPEEWEKLAFNTVRATPVQMLRAFSALINGGNVPDVNIFLNRNGLQDCEESGVEWLTPETSKWLRKELFLKDGPSLAAIKLAVPQASGKKQKRLQYACEQVLAMGFWPAGTPRIAYITVLGKTAYDPRKRRGTLGKSVKLAKRAWNLLAQESRPGAGRPAAESRRVVCRRRGVAVMPDLKGVTMRTAVMAMMEMGIVPEVKGTGVVVSQAPLPGTTVKKDAPCTLVCRRLN